jgi:uncharacterized protein YukE
MSTPNEIKNIAGTASGARSAISQKHSFFDRNAASLDWKGEIGSAFKDANRRVRNKMNTLIRSYGDLNSKLSRLAGSVDRADREERLKKSKEVGK